MQAIIHRLADAVGDTPLLVLPIPTSYFFRADPLEPIYTERYDALADPGNGLHVGDITTAIQALPREVRDHISFRSDAHFSRRGHALVAEFVADEIAQLDGFARTDDSAASSAPTDTAPRATARRTSEP